MAVRHYPYMHMPQSISREISALQQLWSDLVSDRKDRLLLASIYTASIRTKSQATSFDSENVFRFLSLHFTAPEDRQRIESSLFQTASTRLYYAVKIAQAMAAADSFDGECGALATQLAVDAVSGSDFRSNDAPFPELRIELLPAIPESTKPAFTILMREATGSYHLTIRPAAVNM